MYMVWVSVSVEAAAFRQVVGEVPTRAAMIINQFQVYRSGQLLGVFLQCIIK